MGKVLIPLIAIKKTLVYHFKPTQKLVLIKIWIYNF